MRRSPLLAACILAAQFQPKRINSKVSVTLPDFYSFPMNCPKPYGKPRPGWRKAQSVSRHREIQRRQRRNAARGKR